VAATTHRVRVRRAATPGEVEAALALRHAVFCEEQGVPLADELDGRDGDAIHLIAIDGAAVVGTCRLLTEAGGTVRFGRLAVAADTRRRGIGAALLRAAEDEARAHGGRRIALAAQTAAQGLYAAAGYAAHGEPFDDAGIEHIEMEKPLA
jgi:predicted GNAT family N-acyltransferase